MRTPVTAVLLVSALSVSALSAQAPEDLYSQSTEMIPMRDGVKLYTEIYRPKQQKQKLPIIFLRTPYKVSAGKGRFTRYFRTTFRELHKQGYIFAVQDARGRHRSEGKFVWNRPVADRRNKLAIDASTDAHDAISWLVEHVPRNNGRVGMLGVSYPGWYVTMALIHPHPALKAASPQASPSDYFMGDDFFHNGAFRLSPSAELPYLFDFDPKQNARFPYDQVDTYEFFLDLGPIANMNARYLEGVSPTWNSFMAHQTYDAFWEKGCTLPHLTEATVPTLHVVGWWDAENLGGALDIWDKMKPLDRAGRHHLVVGPWAHGQWAGGPRDHLGAYRFGSDLTSYYQLRIEAPFFAHHLKGAPAPELKAARMFQTGSNRWMDFDAWPPRSDDKPRKLYLHAGGRLSWSAPEAKRAQASIVSDPDKPVPYSKRPIMGFWQGLRGSKEPRFGRAGKLWKVEDQRFVADRPDVLSFVTPPLDEDLQVCGRLRARIFGSTTGTDADWVVKLIDVYPEDYPEREMGGYQLMVADDVLRGRFHESFKEPRPLEPGRVTRFDIDLRTRNHMFRKGHRIMVQVQASWFPLIDRNPNSFVDIAKAKAADFRVATQRVHCEAAHPSHLELQIRR